MEEAEYDVVVAGGGTAGAVAGIAAARMGARTLVVDRGGYLGGVLAMGMSLIGPVDAGGYWSLGGIGRELMYRLRDMGGATPRLPEHDGWSRIPQDPELLKLTILEAALESGTELLLHSSLAEADVDDGRVSGLTFLTKGGLQSVRARAVVDCTGDADVIHLAGGAHTFGREPDNLTQPVSRIFWLGNVDLDRLWDHFEANPDEVREGKDGVDVIRRLRQIPGAGFRALRTSVARAKKAGDFTIPRDSVILMQFPGRPVMGINVTRVQGIDGTDPQSLTRAEIESQRQVMQAWRFFRSYVPGFENCYISSVPHQVGVRETRHITGSYVLNGDDVLTGRDFDDQIGRGSHPFDVHGVEPGNVNLDVMVLKRSFGIPLRCLLPLGLHNVAVGGRCISADHQGSSSARGQAACMVTGHAAGVAAALGARREVVDLHALSATEVREVLAQQGAVLERTEFCEERLVA